MSALRDFCHLELPALQQNLAQKYLGELATETMLFLETSPLVPKWTNFTVWAARARSGRKWYQNGPIPPSGQQGPDLVENGTKMNQFHRQGGQGLIWSKIVQKWTNLTVWAARA